MKKSLPLLLLVSLLLVGCASHRPELKAPCDPEACLNRTPVNSWNKG